MTNKTIHLILLGGIVLIMAMFASSCADDIYTPANNENQIHMQMKLKVPAFSQTSLQRFGVADPDGETIQNMYLMCFDKDGYFISKTKATWTVTDASNGTIQADIPKTTCRIHFLANSNVTNVDESHFQGLNENILIPSLYSGPGLVNYWGYHRETTADAMKTYVQAASNTVNLVRNQAQIIATDISNQSGNNAYTIEGIAVTNMNAFGTVAPFDKTNLTTSTGPFVNAYTGSSTDALTLLSDDKSEKIDIPNDVTTGNAINGYNIFENANTQDDPVAVILKITHAGTTPKYHKIYLINSSSQFIPIQRNHQYNIKISGMDDEGYDTFEAARTGIAANNSLISIEDIVPNIDYNLYSLSITKGSSQLFQASGDQYIDFVCKYKGQPLNDANTESAAKTTVLSAAWGQLGGMANKDIHVISYDSSTGKGRIKISLNTVGKNMQHGILYLTIANTPINKGINVYSVSALSFEPFRVSQKINDANGKEIIVSFNVPSNFPTALLPLTFKIATNRYDGYPNKNDPNLDIVAEVTPEETDWNYKYLYKVNRTGPQRVYFRTIDTGYGNGGSGSKNTKVYLEDDKGYFTKTVNNFSFKTGTDYAVTLSTDNSTFSTDETTLNGLEPVKSRTLTVYYKAGTNGALDIYTKNFSLPSSAGYSSSTITNGITNYHFNSYGTNGTFVFTSNTPRYDENIWFQSETNQSGSVLLRTQQNFQVTITPLSTYPPYGVGNTVDLTLKFPVHNGTITYTILTKNLSAVDETGQGLTNLSGTGYNITPNTGSKGVASDGTVTLHFKTKKVISRETLQVMAADASTNDIDLNPVTYTMDNQDITGTMTCTTGFSTTNTFAYIEDNDGNRIGTVTIGSTGTSRPYTLRLRSYYTIGVKDNLTLHVTDDSGVDRKVTTTLNTLLSNPDITMQ